MISSRPTEAAIHVAIMRSWRPLGRTFFLGVVGSAILFVAKANPADAPDQKAPTGGVSTANLSNQWAEERRVESGRIEMRRELISEIRDEISGTLYERFNLVKKNRLDVVGKLTENGKTAQSIDQFKDLAALVYYYSPEAIDAQSRIGSWEKKARQRLAFLQTTDDPTTDTIKSLSEIVKSAAAEGDASIANCYSSKNVSQDSSGNFIFKDMDAAKAWLSECVAAINNFNNNAESDPINKIRQKSEEIIGNLDLENRRSKDKIDILDKQIRDELTRSSAREQQVASQMEQEFEFRKIIFFVGLPIFAAVILVLIIAPRLYGLELQKEFFGSPFVLNLFTVFILSVAIIILAVSRSLDPQSVGTLLGGIAGYVLGSSKKT